MDFESWARLLACNKHRPAQPPRDTVAMSPLDKTKIVPINDTNGNSNSDNSTNSNRNNKTLRHVEVFALQHRGNTIFRS